MGRPIRHTYGSIFKKWKWKVMYYCLVICRVSLTNQIYHRATKQRGDKFDGSMTRGKLLDNNTSLFIFYFYSNDDPRDPENRRQNRFSERRFLEKPVTTGWMGKRGLLQWYWRLSANNAQLVSVGTKEKKKESSHIRISFNTSGIGRPIIHTYVRIFSFTHMVWEDL